MMMKKIAGILRCVVFLLILVITLSTVNGSLRPKYNFFNAYWPTSTTYSQFYEMEENSIDVLFMGSSVTMNYFSPLQIYKDYGIRSFNLGGEQQSPFLSYYWLKEALRYQNPQAVVMDVRFCYPYHPEQAINTSEGLTRKAIDPMRLSPVKMELVHELCALDSGHDELSYYLTNLRYHDRWKTLEKSDFYRGEFMYSKMMGYTLGTDTHGETYQIFEPQDPVAVFDGFHALSMEYLEKIAVLCKEQEIELILVSAVGNEMNDGIHNTFTAFAEKHGIAFYNFSEKRLHDAIGAKFPEESILRHATPKGAVKISQFMGRLLAQNHGIEGVEDRQWAENLPFYENVLKMHELQFTDDLETYLSLLPEKDCTIFMTVKDDAYTGMPEGIKEELKRLGLYTEWNESMYRQPYMAILSDGKIIEGAGGYQAHSGRFIGGRYDVKSIGYSDGNVASVMIEGKECSVNRRGLNIVVYSHYQDKVIDSVNFDVQEGASALRMAAE